MGKILVKQDVPPMQMGIGGPGGGGVQVNLPMGGQKPTMREWGQLGGWKGRLGQAGKIGSWLGAGIAGMDALASASQAGSLSGALNAPLAAYSTQQTLDPSGQMMGAQQGLTNIRGQNENQQILDQAAQEKTRRENVRADRSNRVPLPAPAPAPAQPASLPNIPKAHAQQVPAGWNPSMNQQPPVPAAAAPVPAAAAPQPAPTPVQGMPQPAAPAATPTTAGAAIPQGPFTLPPVNTAVHQSMSSAATPTTAGAAMPSQGQPFTLPQENTAMPPSMSSAATPTTAGAAIPQGPFTLPQVNTAVPPMDLSNIGADWEQQNQQQGQQEDPWGELPETWGKGFVPAFMEVYGDIIKGMTPHETGSLASMVYLKMR